mmetsp:Transcript_21062/g.23492  ORF Transcript_21062/g.23492 Transcript_21062/m.23492 type:complete len:186 (+) Transcript_21062:371-928(+)
MLEAEGKVRLFENLSSKNEQLVMLAEDYIALIRTKQTLLTEQKRKGTEILDRFIDTVLDGHRDVSISKERLFNLCGDISDEQLALLVSCGVLVRKNIHSYFFAIPGAGRFCSMCEKGQGQIVKLLEKSSATLAKELPLTILESKKIRCPLGVKFILQIMEGKGMVERIITKNGDIIKLNQHHSVI